MKSIINIVFIAVFLCASCSSDSSGNSSGTQPYNLRLKVNGVEVTIPNTKYTSNVVGIGLQDNVFHLTAYYGRTNSSLSSHIFELIFDKKGNIISAKNSADANTYGDFTYANYDFFPSNYFHITNFSLDESTKKIKLTFYGNLYLNGNTTSNLFLPSLDREFVQAEGEIDMNYEVWDSPYKGIYFGSYEQYCTAKFNDISWEANRANEITGGGYSYGSFMASDPYKIKIHFGQDANLGSYDFTNASTVNYITFSKFNTTTLTYDSYSVNGTLKNEYKEFHGMYLYSYFGSFNFTATNVNNPADVVQVTDGKFRYSHYY